MIGHIANMTAEQHAAEVKQAKRSGSALWALVDEFYCPMRSCYIGPPGGDLRTPEKRAAALQRVDRDTSRRLRELEHRESEINARQATAIRSAWLPGAVWLWLRAWKAHRRHESFYAIWLAPDMDRIASFPDVIADSMGEVENG